MICPKCKKEVTGRFCSYCGTPLPPEKPADGKESAGQSDRRNPEADPVDPQQFPWEKMDLGQTAGEIRASAQLSRALHGDTPQTDLQKDQGEVQSADPSGEDPEAPGEGAEPEENPSAKTGAKEESRTRPSAGRQVSGGSVKVKQTTKKKTKVKRKGKNPLYSAASSAASAAAGGTRTAWKTILRLLQAACFLLMVYLTLDFLGIFWEQKSALGAVREMVSQRNFAAMVYVAAGVCTAAFGAVQAVWMLSRRRIADHGRLRRYDPGRGAMGFCVFLLLGVASRYVTDGIPAGFAPFLGIRQYLSVVRTMGNSLIYLSLLGVILCFVRKVGTR